MPRFPSLRFLSPRTADWLIYNVDRPLGFYITILIGIACAGFNVFEPGWLMERYPAPVVAVGSFVGAIAGVCLLLVVLWGLWRTTMWLLVTMVRSVDWLLTRLQRYLRSPE
jgi:uncharacterized membrane protein YeaQ/YmgE (transglycosylase-associated protein family)